MPGRRRASQGRVPSALEVGLDNGNTTASGGFLVERLGVQLRLAFGGGRKQPADLIESAVA